MHRRLGLQLVATGALLLGASLHLVSHADEEPHYDPNLPRLGCFDFADDSGDAKLLVTPSPSPVAYPLVGTNRGLDLLGVSFRRLPEGLKVFLKVADVPVATQAPNVSTPGQMNVQDTAIVYRVDLNYGGKAIFVETALFNETQSPVASPGPGFYPRGDVAGATMSPAPTSTIDATNDLVTFTIPDATFDGQIGKDLDDGETVSAISAQSQHVTVRQYDPPSDIVAAAEVADRTWPVGRDFCFGAPPVEITQITATPAQYGDVTTVSAIVSDGDTHDVLEEMTVSFTLGGVTKTAVTDEEGVARTSLTVTEPAGARKLVVKFAGDLDHKLSTAVGSVTVSAERTAVKLAVAKSSATARMVTATVTDDDKRAVARQPVAWYVNNRKVSTMATDALGRAVLKNVPRGATVKAVFGAVTGKYLSATATVKAA